MINMSSNPLNRVILFVIFNVPHANFTNYEGIFQSPKSGHIVCNFYQL